MAVQGGAQAWMGKGKTVEEAVEKAWDKARKPRGTESTFDVLRISVHGKNPITGYSVILAPPGK
jgi:hypothetical protein